MMNLYQVINAWIKKSVSTKNYELFNSSDLQEWYESPIIEPILASLEEFQERDSGWIAYLKFDY